MVDLEFLNKKYNGKRKRKRKTDIERFADEFDKLIFNK